jgi:hypothetical protein
MRAVSGRTSRLTEYWPDNRKSRGGARCPVDLDTLPLFVFWGPKKLPKAVNGKVRMQPAGRFPGP